jgi:hypothetical protein
VIVENKNKEKNETTVACAEPMAKYFFKVSPQDFGGQRPVHRPHD